MLDREPMVDVVLILVSSWLIIPELATNISVVDSPQDGFMLGYDRSHRIVQTESSKPNRPTEEAP